MIKARKPETAARRLERAALIRSGADTPEFRAALKDEDGILSPDAIAENYWRIKLAARESVLDPVQL